MIFDFALLWPPASAAFGVIAAIVFVFWLASLVRNDVSIIDSAWSLLQLAAALTFVQTLPQIGARAWLCVTLIAVWSLRLSIYITWRNHGQPEDYRYRQMRERNQPHFEWKSLYLVFGLQGVLGWIITWPLLVAMSDTAPLGAYDFFAMAIFIVGFLFEALGDWQLARFKAEPTNRGRVLATGLWQLTRHPNYFGEFCMAWAMYLLALGGGGAWTVFAPLLLTLLLLKVSGVALLEKDIGERRPGYREYIARTNAFFPWPPRRRQ